MQVKHCSQLKRLYVTVHTNTKSPHANKQYNKHTAYNAYDPTLLITYSIAQFTSTAIV